MTKVPQRVKCLAKSADEFKRERMKKRKQAREEKRENGYK